LRTPPLWVTVDLTTARVFAVVLLVDLRTSDHSRKNATDIATRPVTTDPKNTRVTGPSCDSTSSMAAIQTKMPPMKSASARGMPRRNHKPRPETKIPAIPTGRHERHTHKPSSRITPHTTGETMPTHAHSSSTSRQARKGPASSVTGRRAVAASAPPPASSTARRRRAAGWARPGRSGPDAAEHRR
jgi:hypothetical protein